MMKREGDGEAENPGPTQLILADLVPDQRPQGDLQCMSGLFPRWEMAPRSVLGRSVLGTSVLDQSPDHRPIVAIPPVVPPAWSVSDCQGAVSVQDQSVLESSVHGVALTESDIFMMKTFDFASVSALSGKDSYSF